MPAVTRERSRLGGSDQEVEARYAMAMEASTELDRQRPRPGRSGLMAARARSLRVTDDYRYRLGAPAGARPARCAAQLGAEGLHERHGPGVRHELHTARPAGLRLEPDGLRPDRVEDRLCPVEGVAGSGREHDEPALRGPLPGAEHGTA